MGKTHNGYSLDHLLVSRAEAHARGETSDAKHFANIIERADHIKPGLWEHVSLAMSKPAQDALEVHRNRGQSTAELIFELINEALAARRAAETKARKPGNYWVRTPQGVTKAFIASWDVLGEKTWTINGSTWPDNEVIVLSERLISPDEAST